MNTYDRFRIDGLTLVAVGFLLFFGFNIVRDQLGRGHDAGMRTGLSTAYEVNPSSGGPSAEQAGDQAPAAEAGAEPTLAPAIVDPSLLPGGASGAAGDANAIFYPYPDFIVTQGVHGAEYNQMAVDIAAGKGAPVLSPINGVVSALYVDEYGNPVLVLDNSRWTVMLYHGQFSVKVGDTVTAGVPVGLESNQGYTVDGFGQLCTGRDCGYHTHINVFDKQAGTNVNPLQVLQRISP